MGEKNLKKALSKAKPVGDAVPVLNRSGKVVGYCGLGETVGIDTPKKTQDLNIGLVKCFKVQNKLMSS